MDTKIQSYEIYTDKGIQVVHAIEKNAVSVILSRLGYKGHELILIESDDYHYPNMQNVYTAENLVEIELDCTDGSEVHLRDAWTLPSAWYLVSYLLTVMDGHSQAGCHGSESG